MTQDCSGRALREAALSASPTEPVPVSSLTGDDQPRYSVIIRNMETGEERTITQEGVWDETADYIWSEGNYACDCNRALFFYNWGPESEDRDCGDSAFRVPAIIREDGTRIEFEGAPND